MSALADIPSDPLALAANAAADEAGEFVTFPDSPYQLFQPFAPAGDQPQAIAQLVDGLHVAEVAGRCVGYGARLPRLPAIGTPNECAFCAANPDNIRPHHTNRPKISIGPDLLRLPLSEDGKWKQ